MTEPDQPPKDHRPRWERVADERRSRGGLGLPPDFTVPWWLPALAFIIFLGNAAKSLVQADDLPEALWHGVGVLVFTALLVQVVRKYVRNR